MVRVSIETTQYHFKPSVSRSGTPSLLITYNNMPAWYFHVWTIAEMVLPFLVTINTTLDFSCYNNKNTDTDAPITYKKAKMRKVVRS